LYSDLCASVCFYLLTFDWVCVLPYVH